MTTYKYIDDEIIDCLSLFLSFNLNIPIENQVVNILNKFIEEHNCEKVKKIYLFKKCQKRRLM